MADADRVEAGKYHSGLIGSTVAGIAGLFGLGRRRTNPYAKSLTQQADYLSGVRKGYAGMTNAATSAYNTFDPAYRSALSEYGDYLQRDPYTDAYSTRAINQATAGASAQYNQAQSNLTANMARRGIVGSSADVGGLAAIEAARAGTFAQAQNNLAIERSNARGQRFTQLAGLYGDARGAERNAMMAGYGAQASTTDQIANIYGGLNGQANQSSGSDPLSALGSLASGLGGILGGW